jgi:hypothetical protein
MKELLGELLPVASAELLIETAANLPLTQLQQELIERRQIKWHCSNSRQAKIV